MLCKPVPYLASVARVGGGEKSSRPMICTIHTLLQLRVACIQDKALYYEMSSGHEFSATNRDLI